MGVQELRSRTGDEARVLVAGAGPAGAILSLELAGHGVRSRVVDRAAAPPLFPKMDYINARSMELLRRLGLADRVREGAVPAGFDADFVFLTGLDEPPVAVWRQPSPRAQAERYATAADGTGAAEPYLRITGSLLEDVLRQALREHPLVDFEEGVEVTALAQDADGVTVTLADRGEEPAGRERELRVEYLVGCDGGGSAVRRALGVDQPVSGPSSSRCSVYFRSSDPLLRRHGRAFITTSARGITLVSRDEGELWTASFQIPDGTRFEGDPVAAMCEKLGEEFTVDEVLTVSHWTGTLAVTDRYREGRVFLAGDSAHQFYPFGGHGANTGIADAVDLGWKLAARLAGWGGEALLDSYEDERRPVALFNKEMSSNLLEVWRRFGQLARDGASREQLAGFLERESYQVDNSGIHFGHRYHRSRVVAAEPGPAPRWEWTGITPQVWPGGRVPALPLADGTQLFDRFGPGLTLVDLSGTGAGAPLAKRAAEQGVPLEHLTFDAAEAAAIRTVWGADLVLVRPDQHAAWRGDRLPEDGSALLDLVLGRAKAVGA
ncbi:FAD-dependent monooxygenase [Streptomyces sp. NPDC093111]|uniref:FAD-dependent monooxygenase n=1 Tax=Streptomyces sp. NPDC093111 TaxID=3154978 RepID=UPI0034315A03